MEDITIATATCPRDVHYARALLGSIRYFYPTYRIVVICDRLLRRERRNLARYADAEVYDSREVNRNHGLELVGLLTKLNLFFLHDVDELVYFDADSIMTGAVLDVIDRRKDFVALHGVVVDLTNTDERAEFSKYAVDLDRIHEVDASFVPDKAYLFSTGHFYLRQKGFAVDAIRRNRKHLGVDHADDRVFRYGDQGLLNYLVNKIYGLEGQADIVSCGMYGDELRSINSGVYDNEVQADGNDRPQFIHFTGPSRRYLFASHTHSAPLIKARSMYYANSPLRLVEDEVLRMLRKMARYGNIIWKR